MSNKLFMEISSLGQISTRMASLVSKNIHQIEKKGKFSSIYKKNTFTTIHISAKKRNGMIEITKQFTSKKGIPLPDQHYKCTIESLRNQ